MTSEFKIGERVTIRPEWRDPGDNGTIHVIVEGNRDERGLFDRVSISAESDFGKYAIVPVERVQVSMIERVS